jgi:hypothetical protein
VLEILERCKTERAVSGENLVSGSFQLLRRSDQKDAAPASALIGLANNSLWMRREVRQHRGPSPAFWPINRKLRTVKESMLDVRHAIELQQFRSSRLILADHFRRCGIDAEVITEGVRDAAILLQSEDPIAGERRQPNAAPGTNFPKPANHAALRIHFGHWMKGMFRTAGSTQPKNAGEVPLLRSHLRP